MKISSLFFRFLGTESEFKLYFEVIAYDESIPLFHIVREDYRNNTYQNYFRKWSVVSVSALKNAEIQVVKDNRTLLISNTDFYIP